MASRIHPGDLLGSQIEKKTFFKVSRTLQGLVWEAMWESKMVPNLTLTPFQDASEFEQRFGMVLEPFRNRF